MTAKLNLKNVKDKLKDNTLDLSLCELKEVPVREIATFKKATNVDLSSNILISLPTNFVNLKQIVKLDLSMNMLTELPENFGTMTQLKYLDLYCNQISRLPLSLGELKNLRWLDLKENPLTEAVATVAGPCSNLKECLSCARNVVHYLSTVKLLIEEEKLRRSNNATDETEKEVATVTPTMKKEIKKKKKKDVEKGNRMDSNKIDSLTPLTQRKNSQATSGDLKSTEFAPDNACEPKSHKSRNAGDFGARLRRFIKQIIKSFFIINVCLTIALIVFSLFYAEQMDLLLQNAQTFSGLPVKSYHEYITKLLQHITNMATDQIRWLIDIISYYYKMYGQTGENDVKEL